MKNLSLLILFSIVMLISPIQIFAQQSGETISNGDQNDPDPQDVPNAVKSMTSEMLLALVALFSAASTAAVNYLFGKKQKKHDAHTDYVYDAKKKMYEKLGPIFFQYSELAETASKRIEKIAEKINQGKITPEKGWLSKDGYLLNTTLYTILIPNAAFRIMQKQLNQYDLDIEPKLNLQYQLAKKIYYTLSSDIDTAKCEPAIEYDADALSDLPDEEKQQKLKSDPAKFSRQSIFVKKLDNLADALICEENGVSRLMTYDEFEKQYGDLSKEPFLAAYNLFKDFHPKTRPTLWRILLVQSLLYKMFRMTHTRNPKNFKSFLNQEITLDEKKFDWRPQSERKSETYKDIQNQFTGAQTRLRMVLEEIMQDQKSP